MTIKTRSLFSASILPLALLSLLLLFGSQSSAAADAGLLILTHGSPSPDWNESVIRLTERVRALNKETQTFRAIEFAHLEFRQPDAATGVAKLEEAGCDRIIVVPTFIFPTSHSHFDLPAVLGLYSSPSIRVMLTEEKITPAQPHLPMTLTQTLSEGDLLEIYTQTEAQKLSSAPTEEVLLIIAHGDEKHLGLIDPIMKRLTTRTCGKYGFSEGNWAYCEVGQSYNQTVLPLLTDYTKQGKKVLVIGLYLASSAERIHLAAQKISSDAGKEHSSTNSFEGVRFSPNTLIDHPATAPFILKIATEALPEKENLTLN